MLKLTPMNFRIKNNERLLLKILNMIVSSSEYSPEFKLAFKLYINDLIDKVRVRKIGTYHALIDYLHEKADLCIDDTSVFTLEQKLYLKCYTCLCSEMAKFCRCSRSSFWPGMVHGKIKQSRSFAL